MRASPPTSPESTAMLAPRVLARRSQALSDELSALDTELDRLTRAAANRRFAAMAPEVGAAGT